MQKQSVARVMAAVLLCAAVAGAVAAWSSPRKSRSVLPTASSAVFGAESDSAASEQEVPAASENAASSEKPAASPVESVPSSEENSSEESLPADGTDADSGADSKAASEKEADTAAQQPKPEEPAASSAASSSHAASSQSEAHASTEAASHASSQSGSTASSKTPTNEMKTADELCDEKLAEYEKQITQLQAKMNKKLYSILLSAYDDYMAYPESERSLTLKVSIVLSKSGQLNAAQNECDAEFNQIIAAMRQTLRENGRSEAPADQAAKAYKKKKNDLIKELTSQAYSGGDGSGQSGAWLREHASEMEAG